jgi:AcrR family transcriptional regulator
LNAVQERTDLLPTADRRQQLRTALVDAAERGITEKGLSGLKARDLAQEVGCALGAIYTVFPHLDALILEVNLRTLSLFETYIAEAQQASGAGQETAVSSERNGSTPSGQEAAIGDLVRLASCYLAFASDHPLRWRALFQHQMAGGETLPEAYLREQVRLFRYIEEPLRDLCPGLDDGERGLLARSLFSSTHGVVALGLDEKLMTLPRPLLQRQLTTVVRAIGRGLLS